MTGSLSRKPRKVAVLINGFPGSGKTTLAKAIAARLECVFLSKDELKALVAGLVGENPKPSLGAVAMEVLWELAKGASPPVLIDSFWLPSRDILHAEVGLKRAGFTDVIEIWCDVDAALARRRFESRGNRAFDPDPGDQHLRWKEWSKATPLALGDVIRVNTMREVDIQELVSRLL